MKSWPKAEAPATSAENAETAGRRRWSRPHWARLSVIPGPGFLLRTLAFELDQRLALELGLGGEDEGARDRQQRAAPGAPQLQVHLVEALRPDGQQSATLGLAGETVRNTRERRPGFPWFTPGSSPDPCSP